MLGGGHAKARTVRGLKRRTQIQTIDFLPIVGPVGLRLGPWKAALRLTTQGGSVLTRYTTPVLPSLLKQNGPIAPVEYGYYAIKCLVSLDTCQAVQVRDNDMATLYRQQALLLQFGKGTADSLQRHAQKTADFSACHLQVKFHGRVAPRR